MLAPVPKQAKTHQVATRYSAAEYELISVAASVAAATFGEFVRHAAVARAKTIIESDTDLGTEAA